MHEAIEGADVGECRRRRRVDIGTAEPFSVSRIYRRMSSTVGLHIPPNILLLMKVKHRSPPALRKLWLTKPNSTKVKHNVK